LTDMRVPNWPKKNVFFSDCLKKNHIPGGMSINYNGRDGPRVNPGIKKSKFGGQWTVKAAHVGE